MNNKPIILVCFAIILIYIVIAYRGPILSNIYLRIADNETNNYLNSKEPNKTKLKRAHKLTVKSLQLNSRNTDAIDLYFMILRYRYPKDHEKRISIIEQDRQLFQDDIFVDIKIAMLYIYADKPQGYNMLNDIYIEHPDYAKTYKFSCILQDYYFSLKKIREYRKLHRECLQLLSNEK